MKDNNQMRARQIRLLLLLLLILATRNLEIIGKRLKERISRGFNWKSNQDRLNIEKGICRTLKFSNFPQLIYSRIINSTI